MRNLTSATFVALTATALMSLFTSCDKNEVNPTGENGEELTLLQGEQLKDITLKAGKTYQITGGYSVKAGATLHIEAGVTIEAIDDDIVDYILIEQGAKINAIGTAENPIVMTAERKESGSWGGIHICGKAPINVTDAKSEIGDANYGGTVANDNSGTLKYIRIEYAGYAFSEEKEANGFTFYGVGSGTVAEYLQAYKGSDDGFEWFGGTLNAKYLVSTSNSDDSFDWTEGWNGKGQFWVAMQENKATLGYDCDCLIEADNNSKNNAITPASHPTLANLTLVGNNSEENKRGMRLRAGTRANIHNVLITGKANNLTVETKETENALLDGTSMLSYINIAGQFSSKEHIYTVDKFLTPANNNLTDQTIALTSNYIGTVDGGKDLSQDAFFTKATYKGAVPANNDWTKGWTK